MAALRAQMMELAGQYAELAYAPGPFVAGDSAVPVPGKVVGAPELKNLIDSSLDLWLTTGRFNTAFEARVAECIGKYGLIEFRTGNCFIICGAQAVVAVDASNLALLSSLGLEYQEGETIDAPWHREIEGRPVADSCHGASSLVRRRTRSY